MFDATYLCECVKKHYLPHRSKRVRRSFVQAFCKLLALDNRNTIELTKGQLNAPTRKDHRSL